MTWKRSLTKYGFIDGLSVHYSAQENGLVRFYASGQFLEFTALYESVLIGASNFADDYRTQKSGVVQGDSRLCAICGREIVNRNAKAIYCSWSCHDTAKWRRKNERAKAS